MPHHLVCVEKFTFPYLTFQEVVAAFEILGTPDKRAAFDEAAGAGGGSDFDARWENREFAWDSDMYKGARHITTLTERIWERRLSGDTVWLVQCYAAWCPACRAFVGTWQATGAPAGSKQGLTCLMTASHAAL